jgi:hypothetical protein
MSTPRNPLAAALAAIAVAAALAGCGAPASVQTPLPGFKKDIQAAQNAVTQSEREAQDFGSTGVTLP